METSAPAVSATQTTAAVSSEATQITTETTALNNAQSAKTTTTDALSSSSNYVAPLKGLAPLPVGSEWDQRLQAVGIPPETLWVVGDTTSTTEQNNRRLAHRHYFMGWYHMELGHHGNAIKEFNEALKYDPNNSHILLDSARAHLAVHEVAEAGKLIGQVLDEQSTNVEALRLQAEAYLASADTTQGDEKEELVGKAVEVLEKARKIQPKNLEVLRGLAKAYVQEQEVGKVVSVYRDIVAVDPRDTYSLLILAQVLSRMDRPEEAIQYYERVIEQRRGFIGGYIYLGQLYERLKRYGDALDLYKQALLVEPRNVDVLRRFEELVQQIHGVNNPSEILAEYKKFVDEYPGNTEVRRIFAERLEADEELDQAIEQYEKILDYDPDNVDACISLGKIYAQKKNYEKSGEYLSRAVDINPEKLDLYDAIASTLIARKDTSEAIAMYRKAIDANPRAEKLYISLAALLENDEKTTDAIQVMENAISKVGDKPELLAVLGKFYRVTDQAKKAEATLRKAYEQESDNLPLFGELLSLYLEEGKTTAAEAITSRTASSAAPGKDVVLSVAAEFYFNAGRNNKAIDLYLQALRESPEKLDYLARVVGIANREKRFDKSLEIVNEFQGKIKEKDKIEQLKAEIYSASGEHDKSITIYRKLLADNPLDLNYYQFLIDALNDAEKFKESLKVVDSAREKFANSDPEAVLMMSGMVHYKQKNYDEAIKDFNELLKRTSGNSDDAHYFLGSVYLDQEEYDKAEEQFLKAIEINPNFSNALNALGYMYADRGVKLDEAKDLITRALDIDPTAPHILDSMGWVLFKTGELERAADYVERAARQFDDAEIYTHLGEIYAKQGKEAMAREMFQHVLELDPDRKEIREKLENITANDKD